MNFLRKLRSFAVLLAVSSFLMAVSLSACEKKTTADDADSIENVKTDSAEKADHPKVDNADHPKNDPDSAKVETPKQ
ncbi:MAG: hypothetical protein ABIR06_14960 [Cyclobacteriaceae bacterium]